MQRVQLLRLDARDRRRLVLREARLDGDLRAARGLPLAHELRDVLGECLDLERRLVQDDVADRFVDDLFEARHVRALLVGPELDDAFEASGEQLLVPVLLHPDDLLDSGHADARQAQLHARPLRLHVDEGNGGCALWCHGYE